MAYGIITCEESQRVCIAFRKRGHRFYSNDLQECSGGHPEWHIQDDCFHVVHGKIMVLDFLGAHPDCTFLANSGVKNLTSKNPKTGFEWSDKYNIYINPVRWDKMERASLFLKSLLSCVRTIGRGYVEQPILHKYALDIIGERPTQIIQPWMFGHPETKATYLWIVGLPKLQWYKKDNLYYKKTTSDGREHRIHEKSSLQGKGSSKDRKKNRSKTYIGIAEAMAEQWSPLLDRPILHKNLQNVGENIEQLTLF